MSAPGVAFSQFWRKSGANGATRPSCVAIQPKGLHMPDPHESMEMSDLIKRLRGAYSTVFERSLAKEAADEIERLRNGGCARDQGLTQYCAEASTLWADAERYRWLKAQPHLDLRSDGGWWTRQDGTRFQSSHSGGTHYGPYPTLDETIDAARKASPRPDETLGYPDRVI